MMKKKLIFLGLLLFLWTSFLRIYNLEDQSWWLDEAFSVHTATKIMENNIPLLDSGFYDTSHLLHTYTLAGFFKLYDVSNTTSRLPSAFFNMLFIGIIFFFTKRFIGPKQAALASLLIAFSYIEIAWSRQARSYTMLQLFFWLAIFGYYSFLTMKARSRGRFFYLILSGISTICVALIHPIAIILPVAFFLFPLLNKKHKKRWSLILLLGIITLAYFYKNYILGSLQTITLDNLYYLYKHLKYLLFNYPLGSILTLILMVLTFEKKHVLKNRLIIFLNFIFIIYLLTISFSGNLFNYRYIFPVLPVIYINSAYLIFSVFTFKNKLQYLALIALILVSEFSFFPQSNYQLESDNPVFATHYFNYTPMANWQNAYEFIQKNRQSTDDIVSTQPIFTELYLNEKGSWIPTPANFLTTEEVQKAPTEPNTNAPKITIDYFNNKNGFIVIDYLSYEYSENTELYKYIEENFKKVYYNQVNRNPWTQIWIYKF